MNPFWGGLKRIPVFVSQNQLDILFFFRPKASFRLIKKNPKRFMPGMILRRVRIIS
jgi:hypothetical protein